MAFSAAEYDRGHIGEWPPDMRGQLFKKLRNEKGYTLEDLALTCGLTVAEIAGLEAGTVDNGEHVSRVAHALGLTS